MCVFDEKLHIAHDVDVHNHRGIILNIELQILKIFHTIPKSPRSLLHFCPSTIRFFICPFMHMTHCIILQLA